MASIYSKFLRKLQIEILPFKSEEVKKSRHILNFYRQINLLLEIYSMYLLTYEIYTLNIRNILRLNDVFYNCIEMKGYKRKFPKFRTLRGLERFF